MKKMEIDDLLKRYTEGACTPEEKLLLYNYYDKLDQAAPIPPAGSYSDETARQIWETLLKERTVRQPVKYRRLYWPVAAAVALLVVAGAGYFALQPKAANNDIYAFNKAHDVLPGGNRAVLTLANGQQVVLDSIGNGTIASQEGVTVSKSDSGELIYTIADAGTGASGSPHMVFNTISTPNGGQFSVVLPDGSKVWLNAASSLKYPVRFTGNERSVVLNGEAYFEVAKNTARPFVVNAGNQTVKVLGTHFNITSYANEKEVKTTLIEGKVQVSLRKSDPAARQHDPVILMPGQQAVSDRNSLQTSAADTVAVMAWKDGLFVFRNNTLKEIFTQIARWYDVEIDLKGLPDVRFDGAINRNFPLSELLRTMEKTNHVKLKIEGRKISIVK